MQGFETGIVPIPISPAIEASGPKPVDSAPDYGALTTSVHSMLRRRGWHDPEDIAQDAMLRAWKSRESFEEGTNYTAWVNTIATHIATDRYRREKRSPIAPVDAEVIMQLVPSADDTATDALEVTAKARIDALLDTVGIESDIRAVLLLIAQGLKISEVATELGIVVGTAKSRRHRGLEQIRAHFGLGTTMSRDRIQDLFSMDLD